MVLHAIRDEPRARWRAGLVVLALAVYLAVWFGWTQGWTWLSTADAVALDAAHRVGDEVPGWVVAWNVLCTVLSPVVFRLLTLGIIVFALLRRERRIALFLVLSIELSALLTEIAKRLADRPRPVTAMVHALGTSLPSGHAVGTMVAVLALWVVFAPHLRPRLRPWAIAAGVLVVVFVGVGRVALNVHHPSDVLAGWALGYVYFLVCLPALRHRDPVTSADGALAAPGTAR